MRFLRLLPVLALAATLAPAQGAPPNAYDQYAIDIPTADGARASSERLNQEMHYAGTQGDYHIATWMRDQLASFGFDAALEPFTTAVPQLVKKPVLQIVGKPNVDFDLRETPIAQDPDGSRPDAGVPFNAWSGSGDVTATVVDAGHGTDSDYAKMKAAGVDVRGHIAVIRYGAEFRGILAHRAQERGASGVIFFSDPNGRDGANRGPAYPDGPYRPLGAVQRGSLNGAASIPVLPVRADIAARILQSVRNYAGTERVRLSVQETFPKMTLWNTSGVLRGTDPSHSVVLGAHRDAWVYGVTDNGSGVSVLIETARALGYLYRSGWRPRFNVIVAGFDGEEIGEVGSAEYVRRHMAELSSGCIAYMNVDEATTGQTFGVSAVAALQDFVAPATQRIPDPRSAKQTLFDRWKGQHGGAAVEAPGGGSDFESFLYDAGVPILEPSFDGVFGVYHSAFDDLRYASTQADPGFVNHRAVAQLLSILTLRLTGGTLPYRLMPYAARMSAAAGAMRARGMAPADVARLEEAIERYRSTVYLAERRGLNPNREIEAVHRLNKLFYGRNGYRSELFPAMSGAFESGASTADPATQTIAELDAVDALLRNPGR